jgi:hypothetical protein
LVSKPFAQPITAAHERNIKETNNGYKGRSRINEHIILLRFLGIILKVLTLEVSVYNVYMTKKCQTTFAWGGGGGNLLVEATVNNKMGNY